jgi:hypothetical protein
VLDRAEQVEELRQAVRAKWQEGQDAPPGGKQPSDAAIKKTAIKLGLTKEEIRRCRKIAQLSATAKFEARFQNLDDDQYALLQIAGGESPATQLAILREVVESKLLAKIRNAADAKERAALKRAAIAESIVRSRDLIAKQTAELTRKQELLKAVDPETSFDVVDVVDYSVRSQEVSGEEYPPEEKPADSECADASPAAGARTPPASGMSKSIELADVSITPRALNPVASPIATAAADRAEFTSLKKIMWVDAPNTRRAWLNASPTARKLILAFFKDVTSTNVA